MTRPKEGWDELPSGLLARMGHSTRAMETFFSFDESERHAILENIQGAATGAEAKARIEHTMNELEQGRSGIR
ncbi:MAG: YdeI/OmpD-associated family protein [Butyricicoccus sp.]|nr:YdeI/OmpD-associated family protein [Butyricicoccus sp.]MBQ8585675.1 YdeI/OmpD-associated family protein [Butyricicoccus sp.]